MTRDEAIAIELKQIDEWEPFSGIPPEIRQKAGAAQIDAYVALGMGKLDEPKNPEMCAGEIISAYVTGADTAAILMELSNAGLKIVKA